MKNSYLLAIMALVLIARISIEFIPTPAAKGISNFTQTIKGIKLGYRDTIPKVGSSITIVAPGNGNTSAQNYFIGARAGHWGKEPTYNVAVGAYAAQSLQKPLKICRCK